MRKFFAYAVLLFFTCTVLNAAGNDAFEAAKNLSKVNIKIMINAGKAQAWHWALDIGGCDIALVSKTCVVVPSKCIPEPSRKAKGFYDIIYTFFAEDGSFAKTTEFRPLDSGAARGDDKVFKYIKLGPGAEKIAPAVPVKIMLLNRPQGVIGAGEYGLTAPGDKGEVIITAFNTYDKTGGKDTFALSSISQELAYQLQEECGALFTDASLNAVKVAREQKGSKYRYNIVDAAGKEIPLGDSAEKKQNLAESLRGEIPEGIRIENIANFF